MLIAGIDISEKERTGSFILEDNTVVHAHAFQEGLEVLGTGAALKKYDWLQDYYWNLIEPDMDKFTETAETDREGGYFIRALPGVKAVYPIQACMFIGQEGLLQSAAHRRRLQPGERISPLLSLPPLLYHGTTPGAVLPLNPRLNRSPMAL
jgi:Fe-S cluster assembly scaffold protein SufB